MMKRTVHINENDLKKIISESVMGLIRGRERGVDSETNKINVKNYDGKTHDIHGNAGYDVFPDRSERDRWYSFFTPDDVKKLDYITVSKYLTYHGYAYRKNLGWIKTITKQAINSERDDIRAAAERYNELKSNKEFTTPGFDVTDVMFGSPRYPYDKYGVMKHDRYYLPGKHMQPRKGEFPSNGGLDGYYEYPN